jgi:lipoyl(octanoyl) transferase
VTATREWRLIDHSREPLPGFRNMAIDGALLASVRQGAAPVLRLYRWRPACLSFGRNQRTRGVYDAARLRRAGVDAVRRPTGGLAVLHDAELTYAVAAPAALLGGPRDGYALINRALVHGLRQLDVAAYVSGSSGAPHPFHDTASPCFQAPSPGEVVAAGRKLVGSAQRCEGHTILQHGSILMDGSQDTVTAFLGGPGGAPVMMTHPGVETSAGARSGLAAAGRADRTPGVPAAGPDILPAGAVTLRELLGRIPEVADLAGAIATGFAAVLGTRLALCQPSDEEEAAADRLEALYAGDDWTWRC